MTIAINYDDVIDQLRAAGLVVDGIEVGRLRRCKVDGDREKRGWYWLHEVYLEHGDQAIVGAFGVWHGNDNGKQEIQLKKIPLTDEQRQAIRTRMKEDRKRAEASRRREAERASARARAMWMKCSPDGSSPYLEEKRVGPHGVRFTGAGTLVVPMTDSSGDVHGLQFIGPEVRKRYKDRDKDFWPRGLTKRGHYHLLGAVGPLLLLAEGYATAAALHEASGYPVAVAFDAGNLVPVAEALHKRYPRTRILVCGDDDFVGKCPKCQRRTLVADPQCMHCSHTLVNTEIGMRALKNAGREAAEVAALTIGGAFVLPLFAERGARKLTDFNDLSVEEGPHRVRAQIEAKVCDLGWDVQVVQRLSTKQGMGGGGPLKSITSAQELFDRFAVIYGHNKSLFDFQERMLLSSEDVKMACAGRDTWKAWHESADKRVVRISEVGFDPSESDPDITCNLWGGWPIEPKAGTCDELLGLLEYLCNNEKNAAGIYQWLLKWLAYPLQNPGAKMKTALVIHGPQRVGKNFFFESVMQIYGPYGEVIDQDALEDKYNDCFSKKLFLIADEVIARQELYHVKNKLKGMITGRRIRINPKNVKSYWEDNHCNLVFLSNETQPILLERDDGRHVVLWTPPKLSLDFYQRVEQEVAAGGIPALYHHLLHKVDLSGFNEHTPPPMTDAKAELMDLSMDSTERYVRDWLGEKIENIPVIPAKSMQHYALYREWCARMGYKGYAPEPKFLAEISKRSGAIKCQAHYLNGSGTKVARFIFPPGTDAPPDKSKQIWLSDCVQKFEDGIQAFREA